MANRKPSRAADKLRPIVGGIIRQELNAGSVVQINGFPFRLVNATIVEGHVENLCAAGLRLHDVPAKNRRNWAKTRTANKGSSVPPPVAGGG